MAFSEFLHSRRADAKALVAELKKTYDYASVLGVDVKARSISANNRLTNIASDFLNFMPFRIFPR